MNGLGCEINSLHKITSRIFISNHYSPSRHITKPIMLIWRALFGCFILGVVCPVSAYTILLDTEDNVECPKGTCAMFCDLSCGEVISTELSFTASNPVFFLFMAYDNRHATSLDGFHANGDLSVKNKKSHLPRRRGRHADLEDAGFRSPSNEYCYVLWSHQNQTQVGYQLKVICGTHLGLWIVVGIVGLFVLCLIGSGLYFTIKTGCKKKYAMLEPPEIAL